MLREKGWTRLDVSAGKTYGGKGEGINSYAGEATFTISIVACPAHRMSLPASLEKFLETGAF
jgi:hypothetical protein